jgi:hypothetical protein
VADRAGFEQRVAGATWKGTCAGEHGRAQRWLGVTPAGGIHVKEQRAQWRLGKGLPDSWATARERGDGPYERRGRRMAVKRVRSYGSDR